MAKFRHGFVSNSSSSSFVLLKSKVSDSFVEQFSAWIDLHNDEAGDGHIEESTSAFFGDLDYHVKVPSNIRNEFYNNVEYGDN